MIGAAPRETVDMNYLFESSHSSVNTDPSKARLMIDAIFWPKLPMSSV